MRRIPARVLLIALSLLAVGAGAWALVGRDRGEDVAPRAEGERPTLMLLTTLPLLFPEQFTLQGGGSKALTALETRYQVVPIGVTDAASLKQSELLLLAHPLAQPAEALVALDQWVRAGGRVLLLADPMLDWPSERPLGDKLRPPPSFSDTGLLERWGLTLSPPAAAGLAERQLSGRTILTSSPGTLAGSCKIDAASFLARCKVGQGRAAVIADADLLNVDRLGGGASANLDALLAELAALEH